MRTDTYPEVTRSIGVYICPTIKGGSWLRRAWVAFVLIVHTLTDFRVWPSIRNPHAGQPCVAKECYRLLIEVNGRRLFAWRHR